MTSWKTLITVLAYIGHASCSKEIFRSIVITQQHAIRVSFGAPTRSFSPASLCSASGLSVCIIKANFYKGARVETNAGVRKPSEDGSGVRVEHSLGKRIPALGYELRTHFCLQLNFPLVIVCFYCMYAYC